MSDSDFPTTVLTSKAPDDVANFIPHSLKLSTQLIENNLLVWFANYASMISRYNQDLNALVANGRNFFTGAGAEFGSLDKIWNCVASSVMSQIQVNEALVKTIKKDVLAQFQAAFKEDFKYSELLVNSGELLEMKNHLQDANGAYDWNAKAPAILSNFENYKKFEKGLLFNSFISYLNTLNSKTSGLVHRNENAVNFILKEYNIDNEMQLYTDYMIKTSAPQVQSKQNAVSSSNDLPISPPAKARPSAASMHSGSTSGTSPVKEKRKSKLMLKMGSILGRKKKNNPAGQSETIPEDASASSFPSRLGTYVSRANTRNSNINGTSNHGAKRQSAPQKVTENDASQPGLATPGETPTVSRPPSSHLTESTPTAPAANNQHLASHPAFDAVPLQPSQPSQTLPEPTVENRFVQENTTSKTIGTLSEEIGDEGPNFVKYSSSEDESDVPLDGNGKRLSLLNAHDLGKPPKVDNGGDVRSRNTSSEKYSFEYGDETKSISTPQHTPVVDSAPQLELFPTSNGPAVPEKDKTGQKSSQNSPDSQVKSAPRPVSTVRTAPPPPPSRKAYPVSQDFQRDSVYDTQNLRDSYAPPNTTDRMSLVSQTTGNSLLRQDHFKHFGSSEGIIRDGLNTSIAEIINATFKDGRVIKTQILGEIAFNYNSDRPQDSLTVHIPTRFTKFVLNNQLMTNQGNGSYSLDLAQIAGKTLGGVKYLMDLKPENVPLLVKQIWKFEPTQASLIIKVSLNQRYGKRISLENFSISAALDSSVSSISASSKPEGSFNKELNRIAWRYNEPLELSSANSEIKLIARIMTKGLAKEATSGVKLRFTISEGVVPNVEILDSSHQPVPSIASLTSGNYNSHA